MKRMQLSTIRGMTSPDSCNRRRGVTPQRGTQGAGVDIKQCTSSQEDFRTRLHMHMHRCTRLCVWLGEGRSAHYPAVARRQSFFLLPLFVWGLLKSPGGKAMEGVLADLGSYCYGNPCVVLISFKKQTFIWNTQSLICLLSNKLPTRGSHKQEIPQWSSCVVSKCTTVHQLQWKMYEYWVIISEVCNNNQSIVNI